MTKWISTHEPYLMNDVSHVFICTNLILNDINMLWFALTFQKTLLLPSCSFLDNQPNGILNVLTMILPWVSTLWSVNGLLYHLWMHAQRSSVSKQYCLNWLHFITLPHVRTCKILRNLFLRFKSKPEREFLIRGNSDDALVHFAISRKHIHAKKKLSNILLF